MDEDFHEVQGEAGAGVDGGQAGRVPALAEEAGAFAGPDRVRAGGDAPEAYRARHS